MKTQDLLISNKKKEKIWLKTGLVFSLISVIGIVSVIIFTILFLIYKKPFYDTISAYGLTIFILPFVLLQFFLTAGLPSFGYTDIPKWGYIVFYLIAFPFADMWFFGGINALYHIIPNYHVTNEIIRDDLIEKSWLYIGGIYFSIIGLGLIWRIVKNTTKNVALAF